MSVTSQTPSPSCFSWSVCSSHSSLEHSRRLLHQDFALESLPLEMLLPQKSTQLGSSAPSVLHINSTFSERSIRATVSNIGSVFPFLQFPNCLFCSSLFKNLHDSSDFLYLIVIFLKGEFFCFYLGQCLLHSSCSANICRMNE